MKQHTTHGAKGKGVNASCPKGNRGPNSSPPAQGVNTGNCLRYAFPTTGGRRKD